MSHKMLRPFIVKIVEKIVSVHIMSLSPIRVFILN